MKKRHVNLSGLIYQTENNESAEFYSTGHLRTENGKKILSYSGVFDDDDVTEIEYDDKSVLMKIESKDKEVPGGAILFQEGKVYSSYHVTPAGILNVEVLPTLINVTEEEDSGKIELSYISYIGDMHSTNKMEISYKYSN